MQLEKILFRLYKLSFKNKTIFFISKAFASNHKFWQANIAIIKKNIEANISSIKTFSYLYNFKPEKYFTI